MIKEAQSLLQGAYEAGYEFAMKEAEHEPRTNLGGVIAVMKSRSRQAAKALAHNPKTTAVVAGTSLLGGGTAGFILKHQKAK